MSSHHSEVPTAATQLLQQLKREGVHHLLANAGTDFPSIIEALSKDKGSGEMPTALAIHHENVAVGMAHGYYLASGHLAAVMVHVNVGLANCTMGTLNAASSQVPILLMSGRTPITEGGRHGSRLLPIHWGQEMYDQAAMVREATKWEYELRYPEQAATAVHRAVSVATAAPAGPVYLSLPREGLAETVQIASRPLVHSQQHAAAPNPTAVQEAANLLASAKRPVVVVQRTPVGGEIDHLASLAHEAAWGVCEFWPTANALATDHPSHIGFEPAAVLKDADVVVTIGAMVPWSPMQALPPSSKVIAIGLDPLEQSVPFRGFPADVLMAADPSLAITALRDALQGMTPEALIHERRKFLLATRTAQAETLAKTIQMGEQGTMNHAFISRVISDEAGPEALVFSELGAIGGALELSAPGRLFWTPLAGGLGWGVPAALGAKLAQPERTVIATVGDGSYLFANPSACHQVSAAHHLPVLTIVFNNGRWQAVKRATLSMYPDGEAAAQHTMPLTDLGPPPDYCAVAQAHGAYAERVDHPSQLREALRRALHELRQNGRQVLLDVAMP